MHTMLTKTLAGAALATLAFAGVACGTDDDVVSPGQEQESTDGVDDATSTGTTDATTSTGTTG